MKRWRFLLAATLSAITVASVLLVSVAGGSDGPVFRSFEYSGKSLCENIPGASQTTPLGLPGSYQTAISIHFPWTSNRAFAPVAGAMTGDYLAYFNRPTVGGRPPTIRSSLTIQNKLLAYIDGATPGSEIRGHITTISKPAITCALKRAHERGVTVYLVQNGQGVKDPGSSPEGDALEEYFGTRHVYCYEDRGRSGPSWSDLTSCVSSIAKATHHIKNWLFSNTVVGGKTRTYSTWVTSYNLTETSDKQFNDVFIVNGNYELYRASVRSFESFYRQRRSDDFYNIAGRGHHVIASANVEISYSPQKANDYVAMAMALSRIDRYEPGCALKVANLSISGSRRAIIKELLRIRRLGCQVQIAYSESFSGLACRLSEHVELRVAKKPKIHSKMMLYKGRYDGAAGRTFVWGGSHNWTRASLRVRDEVFVAILRLGIYKLYSEYFDDVWASSTPVPPRRCAILTPVRSAVPSSRRSRNLVSAENVP
jgi:phosphatidylserine/phosphatidylglycerophosphate/cardiolipin synthase-like enzyme